jgi:hemerythrin
MATNEPYSVGVASLDDDHKQMFAIVSILHSAMSASNGARVAPKIVKDLAGHAQSHFSAEEALMEGTRYPELASHRREHEELLKKFEDFQRKIAAGTFVSSSVTVAEFVDKCLIPHTNKTDQKYSEHLNANGIF